MTKTDGEGSREVKIFKKNLQLDTNFEKKSARLFNSEHPTQVQKLQKIDFNPSDS